MKAALVLIIGMFFWLATPAVSDAHQENKNRGHDRSGYSQNHDNHNSYWGGYKQNKRHHQKAWKKQRKARKHWAKHHRHQAPVKIVYRDRWPNAFFPPIIINVP